MLNGTVKMIRQPDIPYQYRHAPVPGGGFVTGLIFHPREKGILYARTDIGGVYRYDFETNTWLSLMDHVTAPGKWESYPLSIAIDENNPNRLYVAAGDGKESYLCRSEDRGETFSDFPLPAGVYGNAPGRGTGERLVVDGADGRVIYLGTQTDGLFVSDDRGETWRKLYVRSGNGNDEINIAFIWLYPSLDGECRSKKLVVATSGQCNSPDGRIRGKSLYYSSDGGMLFSVMPGQPDAPPEGDYPGYVGQRAAFADGNLYVTMASVLHSWQGFDGYGCDMGGHQTGCILRYNWPARSDAPLSCTDITPEIMPDCGFGGICADRNKSGRLICSTQCAYEDAVLITNDGGDTWRTVLQGLKTGKICFTVPYMKPEYNGGRSLIHWLSDIKIDPFDSNRALFNTGTGIFMTENLTEAAIGAESIWTPACTGLEETVHLSIYSPPDGDKRLIDMIGDLGGFAFNDLTKPAENSFADENGNRYITCQSADFPDDNPCFVIAAARGNWMGETTGGLIISEDQCDTWRRLNDPTGISRKIDQLIHTILQPNRNAGWCAVSSDEETIVWCVADGDELPIDCVVYTTDRGYTWAQSVVINRPTAAHTMKVIADRVTPGLFYGFGNDSLLYVSRDGARHFQQVQSPEDFPRVEMGGIDNNMSVEIRAESGKNVVWLATGSGGLWRVDYSSESEIPIFRRVTPEGDSVFKQGMGKAEREGGCPTMYINGILNGEYGFWRSSDEGASFARINTSKQMYGDIRSITGDPRLYGRVYIATGSRGVLWGDPIETIDK